MPTAMTTYMFGIVDEKLGLRRFSGESDHASQIAFSARISDLIPAISGVLQIRVGIFADRLVGEALTELKFLASRALHGHS